MASEFALKAELRQVQGKQVKQLRNQGDIPGVVYGHGFENQLVAVPRLVFQRVYNKAGHSGLVELSIGEKAAIHVLIAEVQNDHLGVPQHADFHQVKMDEVVRTEVPLRLVGESPAVYNLGGSLIQVLEEIEVEALPANLPQQIEVDVTELTEFDQSIAVSDLKIPDKVEVLTEGSEMVCKTEAPRSDAEMAELDAEMGDAVGEAGAEEGSTEGEAAADAPAEGEKSE